MGAIASGGARVLNESVLGTLQLADDVIEAVTTRELAELERRERAFRNGRPLATLAGRTIILVDDGIATGSTMKVAIEAVRQLGAHRIVVAVPTAAPETVREMRPEVDELVTVMAPADFRGVGQWYEDFSQTTDEEVRFLLERATRFPDVAAT